MRLAVLSDCRVPTRALGGHGLGRLAWDLANGLAKAHDVLLWAGADSDAPEGVELRISAHETERARFLAANGDGLGFDAYLDLTHRHELSQGDLNTPILNWVVDTECPYTPPCAVVANAWQQRGFPNARIVPLGIDVEAIPFIGNTAGDYLAFAHKIEPRKGADTALELHLRQPIPVRFLGQRYGDSVTLPWWQDELTGDAFYRFLGGAWALLSPARQDAGGRVNLEAAAVGTPVCVSTAPAPPSMSRMASAASSARTWTSWSTRFRTARACPARRCAPGSGKRMTGAS